MRRLRADWKGRYGYEPLLVETFVECERFEGTCYRAANWLELGQTQGRGRQDRGHSRRTPIKRIFVYPLQAEARQRLCEGMLAPVPASGIPAAPQDWAEAEFGSVDLKDRRLNRRAVEIARDFYGRPQAQIPQACQSRARTKAAYRFFKHPNTNMDDLLEPHRQSTYQRIVEKKIVLCPQDTTSLNYSTHPATENLGPIGSTKEGIIGLIVHDTMAFSIEGTPLGLLDVQCWARDADEFGKKHQRKQRPIEEKESYKWLRSFQSVAEAQRHCPNTMLVSMGDREADIHELFHLALQDPKGPRLLVRAEYDRLLEDGQGHLWANVAAQPLVGIQEIHVPRRGTIEACLAVDMVVAWRIYHMTKLGREVPDVPCTVFCEQDEWKALVSFILKRPIIDGTPPTAREYLRMVGSLGGFLGRKCDGEPGTKSIWLGQQRLDDMAPADTRVVSAKGDLAFLGPVTNHAHLSAPKVVCPQILKPHALDAEDAPVVAFSAGLHSIVPVAIGALRCRPEQIHDL